LDKDCKVCFAHWLQPTENHDDECRSKLRNRKHLLTDHL